MNIDQAWHRYNNDVSFNQLVKILYQLMYKMQFTHEELRNAVFLAAVMIEENRTSSRWYLKEKNLKVESIPKQKGDIDDKH